MLAPVRTYASPGAPLPPVPRDLAAGGVWLTVYSPNPGRWMAYVSTSPGDSWETGGELPYPSDETIAADYLRHRDARRVSEAPRRAREAATVQRTQARIDRLRAAVEGGATWEQAGAPASDLVTPRRQPPLE